jgi:hypothetical protein
MTPILENAVLVSIVIAILFAGYHIAMHLVRKQTEDVIHKMHNDAKPLPTVDTVPGLSGQSGQSLQHQSGQLNHQEPAQSLTGGLALLQEQQRTQQPQPSDPAAKADGSSTFVTDLRKPENSFSKHEALPDMPSDRVAAQNDGQLDGIFAYDGAGAQGFSDL